CYIPDYVAAHALYEECLAIRRELGDRAGTAETLTALGLVQHERGDQATALSYLAERLAIQQEAGDRRNSANTLYWLGRVTEAQGDLAKARAFLEEAYTIDLEAGQRDGHAQGALGDVLCMQGDYAAARTLLSAGLQAARELREKVLAISLLEYLAWLAHSQGQSERAVRLYGAAEAQRAAFGYTLSPLDQHKHVLRIAAVRAALEANCGSPLPPNDRQTQAPELAEDRGTLDEAAFTIAWERGRAMTMEQAIEYALERSGILPTE